MKIKRASEQRVPEKNIDLNERTEFLAVEMEGMKKRRMQTMRMMRK